MKREIICQDCFTNMKALLGKPPLSLEGVDERHSFVRGLARGHFMCDECARGIAPGTPCTALSVWNESRGIPYRKWEDEYIQTFPKEGSESCGTD
jgi:hypothetical protein